MNEVAVKHTLKVEALTFLRFLAALGVVLFHFGPAAGVAVPPGLGPIMVTFFFVLSGFVLAITYLPRPLQAGRFLLNRFSRIGPIYYVALLLMLAIGWQRGRVLDSMALGLDLLFLQAWIPPYPLAINPPAWSLSVEAAMYFSFPMLAALVSRRSPRAALGIALAAWVLTQAVLTVMLRQPSYSPGGALHDLVYYSPLAHCCSFLLGVAGGHWYLREGCSLRRTNVSVVLLGACLLLLCLAIGDSAVMETSAPMPLAVSSSFLAPVFLLLVLCVSVAPNWVGRSLSPPAFVVLGNASCSLYILQLPAYLLYCRLLPGGQASTKLQLLGFAFSLTLASVAAFYLFERPVMRALRRTWRPRPVPLPATAVE